MNSAVRQLFESSARFPLAMLAFGAQQGARVLSDGAGPVRTTEASLYVVSQAAQRELSDILLGGFQIGDAIQREIVDMASDILWPGQRSAPAKQSAGGLVRSLSMLPLLNLRLAVQELNNKAQVYNLVRRASGLLREPHTARLPLMTQVDCAYALPEFERIWAVEGLGHDYAATFGGPSGVRGVLTSGPAEALPAKALTMMHAGMGLAFAEPVWNSISPHDSEARIRQAIERFEQLCADNSRDGYAGAARESLGLVTRINEPLMMPAADRAIQAIAPDLAGFFWHGAGRALYFSATHFIPGLTSPWPEILHAAPHREGTRNLIAGLAWATALVNMRHPEIVSGLLPALQRAVLETGAFANGVSSALMMAYDIEPANPWIEMFLNHAPGEQPAAALWGEFVREPCRYALDRAYPELKSRGRLEELFRCAPEGSE